MRYGNDHRWDADARESWLRSVEGPGRQRGGFRDRGGFDTYSRRDFLTNQGDFSDRFGGGRDYGYGEARGSSGRNLGRAPYDMDFGGGRHLSGRSPGRSWGGEFGGYGSDRGFSSGYREHGGMRGGGSDQGFGRGGFGQPGFRGGYGGGQEGFGRDTTGYAGRGGRRSSGGWDRGALRGGRYDEGESRPFAAGWRGQWETDPYDLAYRNFRKG